MKPLVVGGMLAAACGGPSVTAARADNGVPTAQPTQSQMEVAFLAALLRLSEVLIKTPDTVVAEIGDRTITRGDVAEALGSLPPSNGARTIDAVFHDTVNGLLGQKALEIRAREKGIDKDPLVAHRMTVATDAILANEFLKRAIAPVITDQLLHTLYDRQVAGEPGPEEVRARVIMTYSRQDADKVMSELGKGQDFAAVAKAFSQDASAPGGGDIGFVRLAAVLPEIGAVMFALSPGQRTAFPVRAGNGWYAIEVEARRQQPPLSFEAVRSQLVQQLTRSGIASVVQQAVTGLTVHDYGLPGKDPNPDSISVKNPN